MVEVGSLAGVGLVFWGVDVGVEVGCCVGVELGFGGKVGVEVASGVDEVIGESD